MPEPSRSPRQVAIADHLWEAFTLMSQDMGVDRDSLINQALFASARQHGYLSPSPTFRAMEPAPTADISRAQTPARSENGVVAVPSTTGQHRRTTPPPTSYPPEPAPATSPLPVPAARAPSEPEVDAVPAEPAFFAPPASEAPPAEAEVEAEAEEEHEVQGLDDSRPEEPPPAAPAESGPVLILYADGREVDRVLGPRFLIGRGKHCDLIINSGKVSREHAAIIREGDEFFMEDLGSSNGTWFDKKRITRRRIEDGDEYFVCSEKITCHLG